MCDIIVVIAKKKPIRFGDVKEIWDNIEHILSEPHGWGYLYLGTDGRIYVRKTTDKKIAEHRFKKLRDRRGWFLVIHGRTKSHGDVSLLNTHPVSYQHGKHKHYLVHNGTTTVPTAGTLSDTAILLRLVASIAEEKGEEVAVEVLRNSSGLFVWYDGVTGHIVIVNRYGEKRYGWTVYGYDYGYGYGYYGRYGYSVRSVWDEYLMRITEDYFVITKHFEHGVEFDEIIVVPQFEDGRLVGLNTSIRGVAEVRRVDKHERKDKRSEYMPSLDDMDLWLDMYCFAQISGKLLRKYIDRFIKHNGGKTFTATQVERVLAGIELAVNRAQRQHDKATLNSLRNLRRFLERRTVRFVAEIGHVSEPRTEELDIAGIIRIVESLSNGELVEGVSLEAALDAIKTAYEEDLFTDSDVLGDALDTLAVHICEAADAVGAEEVVELMERWLLLFVLIFEDNVWFVGDTRLRDLLLEKAAMIIWKGGDDLMQHLLRVNQDVLLSLYDIASEFLDVSRGARELYVVLRDYFEFDEV